MNMKKFNVEKSTESKNGGFVNTLRTEPRKAKLGNTTSTTRGMRRYIKSDEEITEKTIEFNLDDFEEVRITGTYDDPETGEEREYTMVWYFAKGE